MWLEISIVGLLLFAGLLLRRALPWLVRARVPASLVGGLLGLVLAQSIGHLLVEQPPGAPEADVVQATGAGHAAEAGRAEAASTRWAIAMKRLRQWPGALIAVVFAGMLLARDPSGGKRVGGRSRSAGLSLRGVGRQGLMVWIIVLGQSAIGLWVTWAFIQPWYDLPNSTGLLIETGFAGGHGTAAAMGNVLNHPSIGLEEGLDLGILMATAGLIYGLLSGIAWVNVGLAHRWMPSVLPDRDEQEPRDAVGQTGDFPGTLGRQRVPIEEIDPLLLQGVWLALALAIGVALQWAVGQAAAGADSWAAEPSAAEVAGNFPPGVAGADDATSNLPLEDPSREELRARVSWFGIAGSFPLFIYSLLGGAVVRWGLCTFGGAAWIDALTIHRWTGSAMDLLVVAAVTTLDLTVITALWLPFVLLFVAGAAWSTFCLLFLSRRILPEPIWFPLALINFGMSTGTTATGFVLLRVVDPELRTGAAEDYALAAPLSAPFIGGGMLTIGLPLLLLERIPIVASAASATLVVVILVAIGWQRRS